jgi:hypothetical protein
VSFAVADLVLVLAADPDARNEKLPDARGCTALHHVNIAMPLIERAHDADTLGIGRPHCEPSTGLGTSSHGVSPQLLVDAPVCAFAEQVEIEIRNLSIGQMFFAVSIEYILRVIIGSSSWGRVYNLTLRSLS